MCSNYVKSKYQLGDLANPQLFQDAIPLEKENFDGALKFLSSMIKIRLVETKLAHCRRDGYIGGPVHLGVGQEAIAVGVSEHLQKTDRVFGAHRSHSHVLALNCSLESFFAEILGRDTGLSRGMGGSMHLWDQPNGFYGSVPIVAGTVPLAVGAGLAAKLQKSNDVAIAYLGDGAMEEGVVHESLNLARIQNLPVVFVVENNLFASHMHISQRQPLNSIARFAEANDIDCAVIDGNNVTSISNASKAFITKARSGAGPSLIEAITYRWYGHVDWREDIDVGVSRSSTDLHNWRQRDPIERLRRSLSKAGLLTIEDATNLESIIQHEINSAWEAALLAPYPKVSSIIDRVYYKEEG